MFVDHQPSVLAETATPALRQLLLAHLGIGAKKVIQLYNTVDKTDLGANPIQHHVWAEIGGGAKQSVQGRYDLMAEKDQAINRVFEMRHFWWRRQLQQGVPLLFSLFPEFGTPGIQGAGRDSGLAMGGSNITSIRQEVLERFDFAIRRMIMSHDDPFELWEKGDHWTLYYRTYILIRQVP